jgi:hypothetical protein
MRDPRREKKHLSLTDIYVDGFARFLDLYLDVALELIKQLLAFVPMIVLSRVRPADDHDNEVFVVVNALIAYGRLQQMPMLLDPLP